MRANIRVLSKLTPLHEDSNTISTKQFCTAVALGKRSIVVLSASLFTMSTAFAQLQQLYCPQNSRYITIGMTQEQVVTACGQPLAKQQSNGPVTQKVPVKQLIYTALNTGSVYPGLNSAFYNQWSLPSGTSGISVQVDVVNDKVSNVVINGSSTNAMSVCGGTGVQVGDSVNKVYNACGSPSMVNTSYINQQVPSNTRPEVWIYQVDKFQSPVSLTFVNGKLQGIN